MNNADYNEDPDVQLMLAFQAGDKQAFEKLMTAHFSRVLNFIFRYVGRRDIAEDLTQEVFIRVYKSVGSYQPQSKFSTWLFTIAKNLSLNELRSNKHKMVSMDEMIDTGEDHIKVQFKDERQQTPAEQLLENEQSQQVRKAIAELPENQRVAVLLRRYEQFTYEEIADVMQVTPKAVKSLLNRAKENLRESLKSLIK